MGEGGPLGVLELAMNRRSFFRDLALGLSAAVFAPHAIDAFKWKQPAGAKIWVMNPDWFTAEYELSFIPAEFCGKWQFTEDSIAVVHPRTKKVVNAVPALYPMRMHTPDGEVVPLFVPEQKIFEKNSCTNPNSAV
jgi:hypothetical protein